MRPERSALGVRPERSALGVHSRPTAFFRLKSYAYKRYGNKGWIVSCLSDLLYLFFSQREQRCNDQADDSHNIDQDIHGWP